MTAQQSCTLKQCLVLLVASRPEPFRACSPACWHRWLQDRLRTEFSLERTRPRISEVLKSLCEEGILERGEPLGEACCGSATSFFEAYRIRDFRKMFKGIEEDKATIYRLRDAARHRAYRRRVRTAKEALIRREVRGLRKRSREAEWPE
ncbi:hypothetical protein ES705_31244 [subsurface metagenome]